MAITINTASSCSRNDVNFAINGGGLDSAGKSFSKLQHGDKCIIPAGSNTWPATGTTGVTVDRNITIVGGGDLAGKSISDTTITGQLLWTLNPTYTDKHRMDIGWMTLIRNNAGPKTIYIQGKCPIDAANVNNPALSGGFRMHHIRITPTTSATGGGKTVDFSGWPSGCVDHCIWDFDIGTGTGSTGEHIIINFNDSPDASPGGNGAHSWFLAHTVSDWEQVYFEDCIFKRFGGLDTNQWAVPLAGGARYTGRHCTSWASVGSGHEARSDSTHQNIGGMRSSCSYKNLFVKNSQFENVIGSNFIDVRNGENVSFGNRSNCYGTGHDDAANTLQLDAYCWTAGNTTSFSGPDGANHWDDNVLGTINPSTIVPGGFNGNISEVSHDSAGSIYATGTDATRDANNNKLIHFSNHTFTPDQWVGFVIRNVSSLNRTGRVPNPTWFAVILSNTTNTVTVGPCSEPNDKAGGPTAKQMVMQANDTYEIRLVRQALDCVGAGTMDTLMDVSPPNYGDYGTSTEPTLSDGTRRWTNQDTPGCSQWDNQFRLSSSGAWEANADWGGSGRLQYVKNARNLTPNQAANVSTGHPSFTYATTATQGAPIVGHAETQNQKDTRVGADAEIWSYATNISSSPQVNTQGNEIAALYFDGIGGPTYPHPFVSGSGGVVVLPPSITSSLTASSTVGNVFSYTITASNSPTAFAVTTTMPAGFTVNTSTGVISCTGPNNVGQPGTYNIGIQASNSGGSSPVATLVLTLSGIPTVQRGKGRSKRIGSAGRML